MILAGVDKKKLIIIISLLVLAATVIILQISDRTEKGELKLTHTKLPAAHKPVYINKISFAAEKETYPVGVLAAQGNLLVTYYNRDIVDLFSLGGRKLGGFKAKSTGEKGFPYNMAVKGDQLAITDFVNGAIGLYQIDGDDVDFQAVYTHNTAKSKLAPFSVFAQGSYYYLTDKNFRGWLVLNSLGKIVKRVSVKGENKQFEAPGSTKESIKKKALVSPFGIIVTQDKRFVISDATGGQIKVYNYDGKYLYDFEKGPAKDQLMYPRGMAVDGYGRIHVVDKKANKIFVYDNYGKFLLTYGEAQLNGPSTITVDEKKRIIYIANTEKQEISIWGY